jgi:predicted nucleotidyltransferase
MGAIQHLSHLRYPLTDILGSRANVRVLRELFRHGGELSAASLAARAKLSPQHVRVAIKNLERVGILEAIGTGRSILWRVRRDYPLESTLQGLFKAEEARFQNVIEEITSAAHEDAEIMAAWIYGSVARCEDGIDSDLDVAIVVNIDHRKEIGDRFRHCLVPSSERLGFRPNVVVLDVSDVLRLSVGDPWWRGVEIDGMSVKGGMAAAFAVRVRHDKERAA